MDINSEVAGWGPAPSPGFDDLFERLAAVAPIGMHLQIAAEVVSRRRVGLARSHGGARLLDWSHQRSLAA